MNPVTIHISGLLSFLVLILAIVLFARAAWTDFRRWKIENKNVVWLIIVYMMFVAVSLAEDPTLGSFNVPYDLLSGVLLFAIGFIFWQLSLFGAGDAKLMFPIGLFIGWAMLLAFALNLALFAIITFILLKFPLPFGTGRTFIGMRINEIRTTKKVPYGVILVAALYLTLAMKFI